jgi:TonB family protein
MNQLAWIVVKFRSVIACSTCAFASASGEEIPDGRRKETKMNRLIPADFAASTRCAVVLCHRPTQSSLLPAGRGSRTHTRKQPTYPSIAAAAHVSGSVVVRAVVSSSGVVEKALIVSGPETLRSSSIDAIHGWSFKPLLAGTEPVRFETDVAFDYRTMGPSSSGRVTSNP